MKFSTDKNHSQIVGELRNFGYSVQDLAATGKDCPDIAVSNSRYTIFVELKTETGKFKVGQLEWLSTWRGLCGYATDLSKILAMFAEPKEHCLSDTDKSKIGAFVERWKLDGKGKEISLKHIQKLIEKL